MNAATIKIDKIMLKKTSCSVKVKIDVEPNKTLHTSPDKFVDDAKIFMIKYPNARDPTEIIAITASPFIFTFCPPRRIKIAQIIVIGNVKSILFAKFKTVATDKAPNATCASPSPIKENLFKTKVTPKSDEQSAIKTPTIKAFITNGYSK